MKKIILACYLVIWCIIAIIYFSNSKNTDLKEISWFISLFSSIIFGILLLMDLWKLFFYNKKEWEEFTKEKMRLSMKTVASNQKALDSSEVNMVKQTVLENSALDLVIFLINLIPCFLI
ncbi:MAG: hypothetical protein NT165_00340 [Candidatus Falkowbacteria bacterium]|nr:hypothetical protein [Candidatus Falkowbacteria bacterium]